MTMSFTLLVLPDGSLTTELVENMEVQIKWPPKSIDAGSLVRKEKPFDSNWGEETVLIKILW